MPKRLNLGSKFLKAELLAMTHVNGEFYYTTDTNELFFCDDDELKLINAGGGIQAFLKDELLAMTPVNGEFYYATDTNELFFCDDDELKLINATNSGGGGGPEAPIVIDLADLERNEDEFNLDISGFNGKHVIITNEGETPLVPETPESSFQFKLINELNMEKLFNPVEFNLSAGTINGEDGFIFRSPGFTIYKEYFNGSEVETPSTEYVDTYAGLLNIKYWGYLMFVTLTKTVMQ